MYPFSLLHLIEPVYLRRFCGLAIVIDFFEKDLLFGSKAFNLMVDIIEIFLHLADLSKKLRHIIGSDH